MERPKLKKDGTISRQGEGGGQPTKWTNSDELIKYVDRFFDWCEEINKRPTVTRLADYLDCDKKDLLRYEKYEKYDWLKRLSEEERKKYSHAIKNVKRKIEAEYEDALFNKGETTGAIFTLKNNYGWKDQQEVVTTNKDKELNEEEINAKLNELGYED
ncbi:hypothetical protein FDA77_00915 [Clostridium botulinum]|nr:hypothetical protein [Clostridium botulinum]NFJ88510.1 hypothetical protein [Clostridium botulinum]HDI3121675.1 hypothetical protein [Clostridium botulinum]